MVKIFRIGSVGNARFMGFDAKFEHVWSFSMLDTDA